MGEGPRAWMQSTRALRPPEHNGCWNLACPQQGPQKQCPELSLVPSGGLWAFTRGSLLYLLVWSHSLAPELSQSMNGSRSPTGCSVSFEDSPAEGTTGGRRPHLLPVSGSPWGLSSYVPQRAGVRCCRGLSPPRPEEIKTRSSKYFASVGCRRGARLGVDPRGFDIKANTIPILLSEWESGADRRV